MGIDLASAPVMAKHGADDPAGHEGSEHAAGHEAADNPAPPPPAPAPAPAPAK